MKYALINAQNEVVKYPFSLEHLILAGMLTSREYTAADLTAAGIVEVIALNEAPIESAFEKILQPVLQSDGTWKEAWFDTETSDERKATNTYNKSQSVKRARDYLLGISDWTQMPDVTLANKAAWATYRQALRDITTQPSYPWNLTWPTPPNSETGGS